MEDTAKNEAAIELGRLIEENLGEEVHVIDINGKNSWTDYFVIATVGSSGRLKGVVKGVKEFLKEKDIPCYHDQKKVTGNGWLLIDCGFIVIHLMTKELREFYALEQLWYEGATIYQTALQSSKSS